ncbi:MAG: hypothetical protein H4O13_09775 [Xanthomonadales bacterium]|nr:hypothetical protein [Xanthomonadales bacterium]
MSKQTLGTRLQRLEAARVVHGLRIAREVIDASREVVGVVNRPGHAFIERKPGEPLEALHARAEAAR